MTRRRIHPALLILAGTCALVMVDVAAWAVWAFWRVWPLILAAVVGWLVFRRYRPQAANRLHRRSH